MISFKKIFQNTTSSSNDILIYIKNKNLLFSNKLDLKFLNQPAFYNFSTQHLNIPKNFFRTYTNYKQFTSIEKFFQDKSLEFIIKHELGHFNNHQFLKLFTHENLSSKSNYIKTRTALDRFFDRTLIQDNPIDDFIHMNFTESYADAYAGLTSYCHLNLKFEPILLF